MPVVEDADFSAGVFGSVISGSVVGEIVVVVVANVGRVAFAAVFVVVVVVFAFDVASLDVVVVVVDVSDVRERVSVG